MYACAYINIGILISTYVHMHTNERRNMLFFPYSQTILADDGKQRKKKAHRIFGCRAQPTSAPHALAQCVHFISQI